MRIRITSVITPICLALMLTGCVSVTNNDPLEGINRGIYKFNDVTDKAVIKPVAGAYKAVLPSPLRKGVNNFFSNIKTLVTAVNDLLQFKFDKAFTDVGRFTINSTFGIAGLIDIASMDGIEQRNQDFGLTLGHWGVGNGAYLVLPFLGPSTLRDTTGYIVDSAAFDLVGYVDEPRTRNQLIATRFINKRAQLLPASDLVDEAALDPYVFMRDSYMQRSAYQLRDGAASKDLPEDEDTEPVATPK